MGTSPLAALRYTRKSCAIISKCMAMNQTFDIAAILKAAEAKVSAPKSASNLEQEIADFLGGGSVTSAVVEVLTRGDGAQLVVCEDGTAIRLSAGSLTYGPSKWLDQVEAGMTVEYTTIDGRKVITGIE